MPIRYPPRREPRVLAIALTAGRIAFAVADPWVVRGTGQRPCSARARPDAVARLVCREKPTTIVAANPAAEHWLRRRKSLAIPIVERPRAHLPRQVASELYPELPLLAAGRLGPVAAVAIATVLHTNPPSRQYAPRHHTSARRHR